MSLAPPWAEHLDFLGELLGRYVLDAEPIVEALRGLERFTALESEVAFETFLDVVRRAIGTLRSEEVLQGQAGAFARRGVNALAVNSLPGLEFARVWILGVTERSFPPPSRQDPILLDPERAAVEQRSGRRLSRSGRTGKRGGAPVRARVRGGPRTARRLLRPQGQRREQTAPALGLLP